MTAEELAEIMHELEGHHSVWAEEREQYKDWRLAICQKVFDRYEITPKGKDPTQAEVINTVASAILKDAAASGWDEAAIASCRHL